MGLSKREIAIFADDEYDGLRMMLEDSQIFSSSNIKQIKTNSIKSAEHISIKLVHWKPFSSHLEKILQIKKDSDALVVYAPQDEGKIDDASIKLINSHRNSLVVNFRGRLLNDILTSMITTSYEKRGD